MSDQQPLCQLCGNPMPKGEEMFNYHGYSGSCPAPVIKQEATDGEPMSTNPELAVPDVETFIAAHGMTFGSGGTYRALGENDIRTLAASFQKVIDAQAADIRILEVCVKQLGDSREIILDELTALKLTLSQSSGALDRVIYRLDLDRQEAEEALEADDSDEDRAELRGINSDLSQLQTLSAAVTK